MTHFLTVAIFQQFTLLRGAASAGADASDGTVRWVGAPATKGGTVASAPVPNVTEAIRPSVAPTRARFGIGVLAKGAISKYVARGCPHSRSATERVSTVVCSATSRPTRRCPWHDCRLQARSMPGVRRGT